MSANAEQTIKDVLSWPPADRAGLINILLESFDDDRQSEINEAWVRESTSRLEAYGSGKLKAFSLEEVLDRVNRK